VTAAPPDAGIPDLAGIRVVEIADETAEYVGLVLAGLGADVVKVEPPSGSPSRRIGPFLDDVEGPERSLFFWQYNRSKRSIVLDPSDPADTARLDELVAGADVVVDATPKGRLDPAAATARHRQLIWARLTPFGDDGPWSHFRGSDLVHLALGGPMMNCGYDPQPDGAYDLPPIAPQMWHAYHIAGEQLVTMILAALVHRERGGGGQLLTCAVHEAVAKNTELDLMNWVMRRAPLLRQTCRHAAETTSLVPSIVQTKDGRWFSLALVGPRDRANLVPFLERYGMAGDLAEVAAAAAPSGTPGARQIPGSGGGTNAEQAAHALEVVQRLFRKFSYASAPWREAQEAGLIFVPLRRPHENVADEHWQARGTFGEVDHPELGRSVTYVRSKWVSDAPWTLDRRAPLLDEHRAEVLATPQDPPTAIAAKAPAQPVRHPRRGTPMALGGIRVLDFTWFLASAGGTRFLASLGAECLKVEWHAHPDTRLGAQAPVGGRAARDAATAPLPGIQDADMGGQFNNKNAGKRGISLNVRDPRGLEIARRLVTISDVVAEGFSPGVLEGWGLGYDALQELRPGIVYAQQSGMGTAGTYGRFRAVGPVAAALAGTSEMSGLPEPAMPAGWGYSYLDWIGAYSFASAIIAALVRRERTGLGQRIDASQTETGIFISGTAVPDWSVHGRTHQRTGNRSPYVAAAPHGAYPCAGTDRWIAIACVDEGAWDGLCRVATVDGSAWRADPRFATLAARVAHQDALDAVVAAWTRTHDARDLTERLQAAGVPAGACQTAEDRVERDPQLAHLQWLTEVTGTKIGTWPIAEVAVDLSATPAHIGGAIDRGAPCYGEDTEWVLGELLGMTKSEITELADDGVV
jgi:crotonobetainyl-CoA:carnitine CoA-transferase CaiB-like acyl-CoA transferase